MYKKNESKSKNRILYRVIMVVAIILAGMLTAGFYHVHKKTPSADASPGTNPAG